MNPEEKIDDTEYQKFLQQLYLQDREIILRSQLNPVKYSKKYLDEDYYERKNDVRN